MTCSKFKISISKTVLKVFEPILRIMGNILFYPDLLKLICLTLTSRIKKSNSQELLTAECTLGS